MHGSWCHLIGNMIFLWSFGLIVEGKIGWARFSALYFVLAGCDGAISQVPMYFMGGEGGALGASGVIFALMMVALIWAPANEVKCIFQAFWFYFRPIDIPILHFAAFFLSLQILQLFLLGWHMSTPMLHLLGSLVGIPIALFMLIRGYVDCEGWDLLSRWSGAGTRHDVQMRRSFLEKVFGQRASKLVAQEEQRLRVEQMHGRDALEHILANPDAYNPPSARKSSSGRTTPQPGRSREGNQKTQGPKRNGSR